MAVWKPEVMLFHGRCEDGFGAAFAAWLRWGDQVEYIPCAYGDPVPVERVSGKHVLMADFSFKRPDMEELGRCATSVVVLDHHESAEKELGPWSVSLSAGQLGNVICLEDWWGCNKDGFAIKAVFDMKKSGVRLAWEFCHPNIVIPRWVELIEDRDLWRFKYGEETREFSAGLRSYSQDFGIWVELFRHIHMLCDQGKHILRSERKLIEGFCADAYETTIGDYTVPCVNTHYHFASDCANRLLMLYPSAPFAISWFRRGNKIAYSLRSEDGRVNVAEVAEKLGGGGHRNSAGVTVAITD